MSTLYNIHYNPIRHLVTLYSKFAVTSTQKGWGMEVMVDTLAIKSAPIGLNSTSSRCRVAHLTIISELANWQQCIID